MLLKKIKTGLLKADKFLFKGNLTGLYVRYFKYRGKAYSLTKNLYFPPHTAANKKTRLGPEGELLAVGGDWTPDRIISGYKYGVYPVSFKNQPILWWTSENHCIMYPKEIHISKKMSKIIRQDKYQLTSDRAFADVVSACSESREYTWLIPEQVKAFEKLHQLGFAHSIEVWQEKKLVGGMFGIVIGAYFHAESMFARESHTSKLAFIGLSLRLAEMKFEIIDCGIWPTEHMKSLGAIVITRDAFLEMLDPAVNAGDTIEDWSSLFENWDLRQATQNHLTDLNDSKTKGVSN